MNNDQILKLKILIQTPCRCILKTYKEWTFIHKINVPFKYNKNLNERWDTRNHPFCEQVLNGYLYLKDNMVSKGNQIQQGKEEIYIKLL